jgi:hypothetical protein
MNGRRNFFVDAFRGVGGLALASMLYEDGILAMDGQGAANSQTPHFSSKARHCIFFFMWGGPSHIDLWDPKPVLNRFDGQVIPDEYLSGSEFAFIQKETARLKGSQFEFAKRGASGIEISELQPHLARCVDELAIIRSMHTDSFNHRPGQMLMNTGFTRSGRPPIGAWLQYGLGSPSKELPGFVVLRTGREVDGGASNWSSGFLPTKYQGVPFRKDGPPILNLENPSDLNSAEHRSSLEAISKLNQIRRLQVGDEEIAARIASYELAFRMQSAAPDLCDLSGETAATCERYGIHREDEDQSSFSRNCLLARRMVERGVRFINIYLGDWDAHFHLVDNHRRLCAISDQPIAALLEDLKERGLLESTLVVWAGEFGRTPVGENRNADKDTSGRDHHPQAFTTWFAGGGVKPGTVLGSTDDLGWKVTSDPVHVNDFHATLLHLFGMDHKRLVYRHQGRDFRLTDVGGNVIQKLIG